MKASFHKSKLHVSEHGLTCTVDNIRHYPVDGLKATEAQDIEPIQHLKTDSMVEFYRYDDDSECVEDLTDGFLDGWITTCIYGCGVFVGLMLALAIYKFIF